MAGQSKCLICGLEGGNNSKHYSSYHSHSGICVICGTQWGDSSNLTKHLKLKHPHLLGYLLPEDEVVLQMRQHDYPVNATTIDEAIQRLGIGTLGGDWIQDDEYFVSFDRARMRPLVVVEVLTPASLVVVYEDDRDEFPYLYDNDLPPTQCPVTNMRNTDLHVSHLAVSAMHRLSKEVNDKTFLIRNLVRLHANTNKGVLSSVEAHINQVGKCWWQSVLVTVPVYADDSETPEGQLPEVTHIAKLLFLGEHELQVFLIENSTELKWEAANFVAVRASLDEFNLLTNLNIQSTLPLTWDPPRRKWKCDKCLFMSDDLDEVKLHHRYAHQNGYCPVHRKRHGDLFPTWELYKAHVEGSGRKVCGVDGCEKWFYDTDSKTKHQKQVHVEKTFVCDFEGCGQAFKTNNQLQQHMKTHEENRERFPCPHSTATTPCPTFLNQMALTEHLKLKHYASSSSSTVRVDLRRQLCRVQTADEPSLEEQLSQAQEQHARDQEQHARDQEQLSQAQEQHARDQEAIADFQRQLALLKRSAVQPSTSTTKKRRNN